MSHQPLVSITMATYNVESFIKQSLDCIVNQTLQEIEIICIDDGSTDRTVQTLNEYTKVDARIKVIAKTKNEGLAVARNEALVLARGKYITFLDGDDLYDLTMIEKAYQLAEKEKSDMVLWDYHVFYQPKELEAVNTTISNLKDLDKTNKIALLQRPAFTWVKLLNTKKIKALGIHFPEGRTRQDIPVHWQLVTALDNVSILPEKLSFYRQQPEATTSQKDKRVFDLTYVMDITKNYLVTHNLYNSYKNEFLRQRLNLLFGMYDSVKNELKEQALNLIETRIGVDEIGYINSNEPLRKQARWFYKSRAGSWTNLVNFTIWKYARKVYRKLKESA